MPVIPIEELEDALVAIDLAHRRSVWRMKDAGAAIIDMPPLQISLSVIPKSGTNAIERITTTSDDPIIVEDEKPLIESTSTRRNVSRQDGTAKTEEASQSDDTSKDTTTETGTDTTTETDQTTQQDVSDQQTQLGTTDRTTTEVTV